MWVSPPGGLYLSVLLRPRFESISLVPLAVGVAVAEAVAEHGVEAALKWPNDVLVGGRKLGGILTEASSAVSGVEWAVVGIGVNVGASSDDLGEMRDAATSIAVESGKAPPVESVAAGVLGRLPGWYDGLGSHPAAVVAAWRERSVPWWGSLAEVRTASSVLRGRLRDVDDGGALVVDLEEGGTRRVLSGELVRLRPVSPGRS